MRPLAGLYKMSVTKTAPFDRRPVGRFAPSPTGDLHFGSMVAAVGSYLQAKHTAGTWLVRIEDLDPPREVAGAADRQLQTLARFGLKPDRPVERQSRMGARYQSALAALDQQGHTFACSCTRKSLPADGIYPGTCRPGPAPGRPARAIRFNVGEFTVCFEDPIQGRQEQTPARQSGDFVIRRADGLIAYQLAVVVDDAAAGVTEVVRGADLIDSTGRQILLQRALGLPQPSYAHLPLMVDGRGRKLSKSAGDDPIDRLPPAAALRLVLRALGHEPPGQLRSLDGIWQWAHRHWCLERVPAGPVSIDVHGGDGEDYTQPVDAPIQI